MTNPASDLVERPAFGRRLRAHISIARFDHWSKNVFVLPGIVVALSVAQSPLDQQLLIRVLLGLLVTGIIASSNYVINEVLDAPFDRLHPIKKNRPAACGLVNLPLAYVQWIAMMVVGLALAWVVGRYFFFVMAFLWIMGCIYNIPPIRSKDLPYLDVISESVNNPLRMLAGWYIVTEARTPPLSLLAAYWMIGCYFMALKRFSEYREINDRGTAGNYRKSFRYYTERSLLVSVMFYASTAMLFFGAFIIRYRMELVISFPLMALVMALYFHLAFDENSCVQNPEHLHKQKSLMSAVVLCAVVMAGLLFYDIPAVSEMFTPSIPVAPPANGSR